MLADTTTLERSIALKTYLDNFTDNYDLVLIEYQMNANDKSREISHFLTYHFNKFKVETIFAGLKNNIHFNTHHISTFYAKYSNAEYARKKHTIALSDYFCSEMKIDTGVVGEGVRNQKEDDFADALMQVLAYLNENYTFDVNNLESYKNIKLEKKLKIKIVLPAKQKKVTKRSGGPVFDV
jgi:hypothetical protein